MEAVAYLYAIPSDYTRYEVKEIIEDHGIARDAIESVFLPPGSQTARIYFSSPADAVAFVRRVNDSRIPGANGKCFTARLHITERPLPPLTKARGRDDVERRVVIEKSPPSPVVVPPVHIPTAVPGAYLNAAGMIEMTPHMFQQYQQAWSVVQQIIRHQQGLAQPNV